MTLGDGKPCKRCGTSAWRNNGTCIECQRQRSKRWAQENKERANATKRRWARQNPEKVRKAKEKWNRENPDKDREAKQKWKRNNPDKIRRYDRHWRKTNPKKSRQKTTRWRKANHEKVMAYNRRRRARKQDAPGDGVTPQEWQKIQDYYGNRCLRCGTTNDITMDHVVPLVRGGAHEPSNIQPLCFSCNSSKKDKVRDYRKRKTINFWKQLKLFRENNNE